MSKRTKLLLGIGVIAALVIGWQVAAFAVHDEVFQLEGNAVTDDPPLSPAPASAVDDWENVVGPNGDGGDAEETSFVSEPDPNSSFFTGGGSKDPDNIPSWKWKDDTGGLPDKSNIRESFAASYTTTNGDELLYFGADRFDGSGDAAIAFWFLQDEVAQTPENASSGAFTGSHQEGDILVISNFSNGGVVSTITVYEWNTACTKAGVKVDINDPPTPTTSDDNTCGAQNLLILADSTDANCDSPNPDTACAIVNDAQDTNTAPWEFADKSGNDFFLPGEFFEGGINLTELGLNDKCFASVVAETRTSTSPTSVLKDFTVAPFGSCGSSVTTQQSVSGGTTQIPANGQVSVSDSATVTVSGTTTWAGKVQFYLCGPDTATTPTITTCAATSQNAIGSPKNVSNTTPTVNTLADTTTVTSAGKYCWSATFTSETDGVPNAVDDGTNECFTVTPRQPTLTTTAGADVTLGNPITDTTNLTGTARQPTTPVIQKTSPPTLGQLASGTITFTLFGPETASSACGPQVTDAQGNPITFTRAVSGDGTYPTASQAAVSFTPTQPGTYHWKAQYSGNLPNTLGTAIHNANCDQGDEEVVVTSVPSSMTTAQSFIPNDSATISAPQGGNLAGSVRFQAYKSSDCTGTAIVDETKTVSGSSPQTVSTTNTTVSTTDPNISWKVEYDSTNPAQRDIPASCHESSTLTITNGGTISSP